MSTVKTKREPRLQPDEADPFFYGWRYVNVKRPDGTEDFDQVPLTLEDVLHPKEGDHIVNSTEHADDVTYLKYVFEVLLANNPHAALLFDCGVDLNLPRIKPVCPDIAVFFGIAKRRRWSVFDVRAENAQSALVIEVTSNSTRKNDFGKKFKYYHRAGVAMYVIANESIRKKSDRQLELIGYHYEPSGYKRIPLNAEGRLWIEALGVWLGVSKNQSTGGDRIACFDAGTSEEIADYGTVSQARILAEARAVQAQKKAVEAQQEAAKAKQKAAKAQRKAKAEAQARMAAEARIRELEALLTSNLRQTHDGRLEGGVMGYRSLAECVLDLEDTRQLVVIDREVDPFLEIAAIQRRVYQAGGPALLFRNAKDTAFPIWGICSGRSIARSFSFATRSNQCGCSSSSKPTRAGLARTRGVTAVWPRRSGGCCLGWFGLARSWRTRSRLISFRRSSAGLTTAGRS